MIDRPALRRDLRVIESASFGRVVLGERVAFSLEGAVTSALVDGILRFRSTSELVADLAPRFDAQSIYLALKALVDSGVIVERRDSECTAEAAYWEGAGLDPSEATRRVREARVALTGVGTEPPPALRRALRRAGFREDPDGEIRVVVVDSYFRSELAEIDRERARPWLLLKPSGRFALVGPLRVPGVPGCSRCLVDKLRENLWVQSALFESARETEPAAHTSSSLESIAALAAAGLAAWVAGRADAPLIGTLIELDTLELTLRHHRILARPDCPACGPPGRSRAAVEGGAEPAGVTARGRRAIPPERTLERLQRLVSPLTGIVDEPQDLVTDPASPVFVYWARQLERVLPNHVHSSRRDGAFGKGTTAARAKVSCLAEALERYSTNHDGSAPCVEAAYRELADAAIHPHALLHFSPAQYDARTRWNAEHGGYNWVPERFDESLPIAWTSFVSLDGGRSRFVPSACCFMRHPPAGGPSFCRADSNGCASGNTREEAIVSAFLELLERDAAAMWWYNQIPRPSVELRGLRSDYLSDAGRWLARQGRNLRVLDITTDAAVPTFAAVSWDIDSGRGIVYAFGCHFDVASAVSGAVSELLQLHTLFGRPDGPVRGRSGGSPVQHAVRRWHAQGSIHDQTRVIPTGERRHPEDYPTPETLTGGTPVEACAQIARRLGSELLVRDLTRPELGFPVVRVVVPALRHFWSRLGPGRLFDVPVELGWVHAARPEERLNPEPIVI